MYYVYYGIWYCINKQRALYPRTIPKDLLANLTMMDSSLMGMLRCPNAYPQLQDCEGRSSYAFTSKNYAFNSCNLDVQVVHDIFY